MSKKPTYEELEQRVLELEGTELYRNTIGIVAFSELENHSAKMLLIDPDSGVIINANIAAQNYYGYSIKTLKQMKIQEINMLSPDEVAQKRKQAAVEKLNCFEFSHRLSSGEIRTVEVHSLPVVLNDKKLLLSIIHDITNRKQAEEKLKVSEERHIKYVEHAPLGIFVVDSKGKYVDVNPGACELLGYTRDELLKLSISDISTMKDDGKNFQQLKNNGNVSYEGGLKRKDDSIVKIKLDAVALPDDQWMAFCSDITDRMKAETELKRQKDLFELVINSVPSSIFWKDLNSVYLGCNTHFAKEAGMKNSEEVVGSNDDVMAWGKEADKYRTDDKLVMSTGKSKLNYEENYLDLEGNKIWWETNKIPLINSDGKTIGILATAHNVTIKKMAQNALQESEEKFRGYIDNAPDGVFVVDENGRYLEVNPAFEKVTGYSKAELLSMSVSQIIPPQDEEFAKKSLAELKETGSSKTEGEFLHKSGIKRWFSLDSVKLSETRYLGFAKDITDRKMAEQAIRESEEKYRNLIVSTTEGFWLLDSDQRTIDVNQSLCDMLGYSRSELIGKMPFEFFDEENLQILKEQTSRITSTLHRSYEINIKKKNGTNLPTISNATSLIDKNGKPDGSFALVTDITERKLVEEELRLNRILLRNVLDIVPVFICAKNLDGKFILVNKKLTDFYGSTVEAMTNVNHADLCEDENELRAMLAADREVIESGKPKFIPEETMENPDGSSIVLETYKIPFTALGEPAVLIASKDITKRKLAEEEKAKIYNSIQTAIYIYDFTKNKNDFINPEYTKLLGWTLDDVNKMGNKFAELFHPDDFKQVLEHMQIVSDATEDNPHVLEYRFKHKNGQWRWCLSYDTPFQRNVNGDVEKMIGSFIDITERKQVEKEHQKLQKQLQQAQKMESVGRLAGGVAHDYNNISSIILGYSELALDMVEESDPLYGYLTEISTAVKRSSNITQQLLAFARKQTVAPKVLDLNNAIGDMLKMLRRLIGEDIDLAWIPGVEIRQIKIDPSQINQIMANLCLNARDAIANVGRVTVETKNINLDENNCPDYPGSVPGAYIQLSVSDDGCGMTPETRDNIFEPFFTTKDMGKGTGLGLSTVYGIVKQNKGFINVYSETEKGTTFRIYLPVHVGQTIKEHTENTIELPLSRGEMILLVEDDDSILKIVKTILENLGYAVLFASNPVEAARLAVEHTDEINLLITDVVMPSMNGRELSERLKSLYPNLKTLFMSGYTADIIAHRGVLESGVSFIGKPFSNKDLAVKVREVLDEL